MSELGFRFIGHPFVDVGVATLCAAAGVTDPAALTTDHVEIFAIDTIDRYTNSNLAGFLGACVFPNARFANPNQLSPASKPKRKKTLEELFSLWKSNATVPSDETPARPGELCMFSGDAALIRISGMYSPGLTDETKINFMPEGRSKLPISGWCLFAILAMPMGGIITEGRLMVVIGQEQKATIGIARENLFENRRVMAIDDLSPRPDYAFARSALIGRLLDLFRVHGITGSLTAYRFNASANPERGKMTIEHLPSNVIRFVSVAEREYKQAWDAITEKANWTGKQQSKIDSKKKKKTFLNGNYLYEDLWHLPQHYRRFLDFYLLRKRHNGKVETTDPRRNYGLKTDIEMISWGLTEMFLKEVVSMNQKRIDAIKDLADAIAKYMIEQSKPKLLRQVFEARDDLSFRNIIKRISFETGGLHVGFDQFVDVYFYRDDTGDWRTDWRLARDLMVIRILEKLREDGWFSERQEILGDLTAEGISEEDSIGADDDSDPEL